MKKLYLKATFLTIIFMSLFVVSSFSQATWKGETSSDFLDANNWDGDPALNANGDDYAENDLIFDKAAGGNDPIFEGSSLKYPAIEIKSGNTLYLNGGTIYPNDPIVMENNSAIIIDGGVFNLRESGASSINNGTITLLSHQPDYQWTEFDHKGPLTFAPNAEDNFTFNCWGGQAKLENVTLGAGTVSINFKVGGSATFNDATMVQEAIANGVINAAEGAMLSVSNDYTLIEGVPFVEKEPELKHSFTFETADTVIDVVGDLEAELIGDMITVADGKATVSGATSPTSGYISLDASTLALATYEAISVEILLKAGNGENGSYTMLAYFGNNTGGKNCFWYQPTRSANESRVEANNGSTTINALKDGVELDDGKLHHVVASLTSDTISYYLDGALLAKGSTESSDYISTLDNVVANIFKGPDSWGDANYNGSIYEFNIYDGKLSDETIAENSLNFLGASDSKLASLNTGGIPLYPEFDPTITKYTVFDTITTLTAEPFMSEADVTISEGNDTVTVVSIDGTTTTEYTINTRVIPDEIYMPTLANRFNLSPDPECTDVSLWGGWGTKSVTYEESYSGVSSIGLYAPGAACEAAMDISGFTFRPNTTYRVLAMVKTVGGSIGFLANGSDPNFGFAVDTEGEWESLDTTFVTGPNAGTNFISFNTCDNGSNCTAAYIDNYEIYIADTVKVAYVNDSEKSMDISAAQTDSDPIIQMLDADGMIDLDVILIADTDTVDLADYDVVIGQEGFNSKSHIFTPDGALGMGNIPVPFILNKAYSMKAGRGFTDGTAGSGGENPNTLYINKIADSDLFTGIDFVGDSVKLFYGTADDSGELGNGTKAMQFAKDVNITAENTLLASGVNDPDNATVCINDIPAGDTIGSAKLQARMIAFSMNFGALTANHGYNVTDENLTLWRNAVYSLANLPIPTEAVKSERNSVLFVKTASNNRDSVVIAEINNNGAYTVTEVAQDLITDDLLPQLNEADVVIMGRSLGSGDVRDSKDTWDKITAPVLSMNLWGLRNNRALWFNTGTCTNVVSNPDSVLQGVVVADDPVLSGTTGTFDFWNGSFSILAPVDAGNGITYIESTDGSPLFTRWMKGYEFYEGSGQVPMGDRTYMGIGQDNTGENYFTFTDEAKKIFFNELSRMTSGEDLVLVKEECFEPYYAELENLVPDPTGDDISLWNGWGLKSIVNGIEPYCGAGAILLSDPTGDDCNYPDGDAALDVSNFAWAPNTTYHLRAMVKTIDGPIGFLARGSIDNGDGDVGFAIDTEGEWMQLDTMFTTSENPSSGFFSFNTCDFSSTATSTYIDNYELYALPADTIINVAYATDRAAADPISAMLHSDDHIQVDLVDGTGDYSDYDVVIGQESFASGDAVWAPNGSLNLRNSVPMIMNKNWAWKSGKPAITSDASVDRIADVSVMVETANQSNELFSGITFTDGSIELLGRPTEDPEGDIGLDVLNGLAISGSSTLLASASNVADAAKAIVINDIPAGTQIGNNTEDVTGARIIAFCMNYANLTDSTNISPENMTIWRNAVYILGGMTPPTNLVANEDYIPNSTKELVLEGVNIYPNPVENNLTITGLEQNAQISIISTVGQVISREVANSSKISINTTNLKEGIYMLKVELNGKHSISRFVKK